MARWVSGHRVTMSLLNNGSLLVIVWTQLCSAHDRLVQQPFRDIVIIIVAAVLLHFIFVAFNWPMILCAAPTLPAVRLFLNGCAAVPASEVGMQMTPLALSPILSVVRQPHLCCWSTSLLKNWPASLHRELSTTSMPSSSLPGMAACTS